MCNDLGLESTIHKRDYMMLWPNPRNAWHAMRASIVYLLSSLELLRLWRKKACFVLETREGGTPKDWRPAPRRHMDLSLYANQFSGICFQKFPQFSRDCVRFGARMALLGFSLFRRGGGADSVRSWRGGDSGANGGLFIIPCVDPEDDHTW